VVVADGFSCRSQIEQTNTGRRALHAAQVLAVARASGPGGPDGRPEEAAPQRPADGAPSTVGRAAAAVGAAALAGTAAYAFSRRG
jgi:hypothetical protein